MSVQNTLTADEQAFFETGELPEGLQAELTPEPIIEEPAPVIDTPAPVDQVPDALETLRQSLATEQRRAADAEARLNQLEAESKKVPEPEAPNPELDPLGAMMHQLNSVNKTVLDLQTRLNEQRQQTDQAQQIQQFKTQMQSLRDDFSKTAPDFQKAYDHLRATRMDDLRAIGVPESNIQNALLQDEYNIAQNALKSGKNPAETIYNMAKRHGYTPSTSVPATQKVAAIQSGQAAARNPKASSPPPADITSEALKNASDSDLDALIRDDKSWAKITGRASNDIFN